MVLTQKQLNVLKKGREQAWKNNTGKPCSTETKKKISIANRTGKKNRQRWHNYYEDYDRKVHEKILCNMKIKRNGCWDYSFVNHYGYAVISYRNKRTLVSRWLWSYLHGVIPSGMFVCHKCDNPRCVNPDHFFLGTQYDNMKDAQLKGRHAVGEQMPSAVLTGKIVKEARKLYKKGFTIRNLSRKYNVNETTLCLAIHKKTWKHIGK